MGVGVAKAGDANLDHIRTYTLMFKVSMVTPVGVVVDAVCDKMPAKDTVLRCVFWNRGSLEIYRFTVNSVPPDHYLGPDDTRFFSREICSGAFMDKEWHDFANLMSVPSPEKPLYISFDYVTKVISYGLDRENLTPVN